MTDEIRSEEIPDSGLTLTEHLRELRVRIVRSLWGIFLGAIVCYNFVEQIFMYVRMPIEKYLQAGGLVYTAPSDKFMAYLKVSALAGIILTTPWWIYQVWKFVAPGLYAKERKYTLFFMFAGSFLFVTGVLFAYFLALPAAFDFLMTFGGEVDKPMITIDHYLGFFTTMLVVFGVAFELPLAIVVMGMTGIVTQAFLRQNRRYIIVVLAIASAFLTPGTDIASMLTLMVPLYVLFEISIFLVGFFQRKNDEESTIPRT